MREEPRMCTRCLLDNTVPFIKFDENGECNYCKIHDKFEEKFPAGEIGKKKLIEMIKEIKTRGKNRLYDCVVGISGFTGSSYCLYLLKKWNLRPLAVHLDNGWNSKIAINNIKKITKKLKVDLRIINVNRGEFKELQVAFLKASVPDVEIPTDIGVYSTLFKVAAEEEIPSVINGHSFRAEGTTPLGWTYMDGKYLESVYKKFGNNGNNGKLKDFPNLKMINYFYYSFLKGIKEYRPLEFMDYSKSKAKKILEKELNWKDYGGIHHESIYTRFIATYYLMKKFKIDKRKAYLSGPVRAGKLKKEDALKILKENPYPINKLEEDKKFVLKKLSLNEQEFDRILFAQPRSFLDFPSYYSILNKFWFLIKIGNKLNLVPDIFLEKYAKQNLT